MLRGARLGDRLRGGPTLGRWRWGGAGREDPVRTLLEAPSGLRPRAAPPPKGLLPCSLRTVGTIRFVLEGHGLRSPPACLCVSVR